MQEPTRPRACVSTKAAAWLVPSVLLLGGLILVTRDEAPPVAKKANPVAAPETPLRPAASVFPEQVLLQPLPVATSSALHSWTSGNAMSPEVIERIAHNPDEFIRMVEENDRIERRQLVYRKETLPALIDRARTSGQPLKSFTLPGLDGREVEVEVTGVQLASDQQGGAVMGRVKGRANSMVSVGFSNGCESFNVNSPDERLFLTADAREPGEVIVKRIDPIKYAAAPCAGPILTENSPPPHPKMASSLSR
jgi:hypothetical protein